MFEVIDQQHTPKVPYHKNVSEWIEANKDFLNEYLDFAKSYTNAVGLASTQVAQDGKRLNCRLIAIRLNDKWMLAINPRLRKKIGRSTTKIEGCLTWGSDKIIIAERFPVIDIDFYDIKGKYIKSRITDAWQAQIWQHEINHLDGVQEQVVDKNPSLYTENNKIGKNDACPCGSGMKYKKCHLGLDISEFLV